MPAPNRHPAAVFFDAYGTLISWRPERPPADVIGEGLTGAGLAFPHATVAAAVEREMAFYRERQARVRTPAELRELRSAAVEVLRDGLGGRAACPLPGDQLLDLILSAFRTRAFPEATDAIQLVQRAGVRTGVLSNFSYLLPPLLAEVGLADLLDPIVFSAAVGAEKPDPEIFRAAAQAVQARPAECVLIGDDPAKDVQGARGVGMPVILIDRGADSDTVTNTAVVATNLIAAVNIAVADDWAARLRPGA